MVDLGFLESTLINPSLFDSEDSQILATIDAVPFNTPSRLTYRSGVAAVSSKNLGGGAASRDLTELSKPTHLISGSSGTGGA